MTTFKKTFNIILLISQDTDGNYKVDLDKICSCKGNITSKELSAINEGCVLTAKELTKQYRQEIAEIDSMRFG